MRQLEREDVSPTDTESLAPAMEQSTHRSPLQLPVRDDTTGLNSAGKITGDRRRQQEDACGH